MPRHEPVRLLETYTVHRREVVAAGESAERHQVIFVHTTHVQLVVPAQQERQRQTKQNKTKQRKRGRKSAGLHKSDLPCLVLIRSGRVKRTCLGQEGGLSNHDRGGRRSAQRTRRTRHKNETLNSWRHDNREWMKGDRQPVLKQH